MTECGFAVSLVWLVICVWTLLDKLLIYWNSVLVTDPSAIFVASIAAEDLISELEILVIVLLSEFIVLLVNVCEWLSNTNVSFPVNKGNVIVRSKVNSDTPTIYWWSDEVSLICGSVNVLLDNVCVSVVPTIFPETPWVDVSAKWLVICVWTLLDKLLIFGILYL